MTNSTNPHPPGPVSEALAACAHAINRFHLAYTRARDAEDQCEVRRGPGYKPPRPPAHDLQIGEVRGHDGLLLWRQARADAHRARRAMDDVGRDACDRISAAGAAARALELDAKDLDDLLELLDQIAGRITARNIPHATEHDQGYHDLHSKFARWRRRIARSEDTRPAGQGPIVELEPPPAAGTGEAPASQDTRPALAKPQADLVLTPGEQKHWDALEHRQLTGPALAEQLGIKPAGTRGFVSLIRRKGRQIEHVAKGYYRPDAPPRH